MTLESIGKRCIDAIDYLSDKCIELETATAKHDHSDSFQRYLVDISTAMSETLSLSMSFQNKLGRGRIPFDALVSWSTANLSEEIANALCSMAYERDGTFLRFHDLGVALSLRQVWHLALRVNSLKNAIWCFSDDSDTSNSADESTGRPVRKIDAKALRILWRNVDQTVFEDEIKHEQPDFAWSQTWLFHRFKLEDDLVNYIKDHQISIISGSPGCGKTSLVRWATGRRNQFNKVFWFKESQLPYLPRESGFITLKHISRFAHQSKQCMLVVIDDVLKPETLTYINNISSMRVNFCLITNLETSVDNRFVIPDLETGEARQMSQTFFGKYDTLQPIPRTIYDIKVMSFFGNEVRHQDSSLRLLIYQPDDVFTVNELIDGIANQNAINFLEMGRGFYAIPRPFHEALLSYGSEKFGVKDVKMIVERAVEDAEFQFWQALKRKRLKFVHMLLRALPVKRLHHMVDGHGESLFEVLLKYHDDFFVEDVEIMLKESDADLPHSFVAYVAKTCPYDSIRRVVASKTQLTVPQKSTNPHFMKGYDDMVAHWEEWFFEACDSANIDQVKYFIEFNRQNRVFTKLGPQNLTAFEIACSRDTLKHFKMAEYMLNDLKCVAPKMMQRGFLVCCATGHSATFELLLKRIDSLPPEKSAFVKCNSTHRTPLMNAAHFGKLDFVKALLPRSNLSDRDIDGRDCMTLAVIGSQLEIVSYLVEECGLDFSNQDITGSTALHWAVLLNDEALVSYICDFAPRTLLEVVDHKNRTAYEIAKTLMQENVVLILSESYDSSAKMTTSLRLFAYRTIQLPSLDNFGPFIASAFDEQYAANNKEPGRALLELSNGFLGEFPRQCLEAYEVAFLKATKSV